MSLLSKDKAIVVGIAWNIYPYKATLKMLSGEITTILDVASELAK